MTRPRLHVVTDDGPAGGWREWSLADAAPPAPGTSLYQHATDLLPLDGRGPLPRGGEPLPDERPARDGRMRFSGGMQDGCLAPPRDAGAQQAGALAAAAVRGLLSSDDPLAAPPPVLARLQQVEHAAQVDDLLAALRRRPQPDRGRLAQLGRWLSWHATTREVAKCGIAVLGASGTGVDAAIVARLGLLEELTLYAAVALRHLLPAPDEAVCDLAQQVTGWGRVHAVRRIEGTEVPRVQQWLLRGGYENGVMVEEVAHLAATTGHLARALAEPSVDDELVDHAGELLTALVSAQGISDLEGWHEYPPTATALADHARHLTTRTPTLRRVRHAQLLEADLEDVADHPHLTAEQAATVRTQLAAWLDDGRASAIVASALHGDDLDVMHRAAQLAPRHGLPVRPTLWSWLPRRPDDIGLWAQLSATAERGELERVAGAAERILPLAELAGGPERSLGLGPEHRWDGCLGFVVQGLREAPGAGWPVLRTALRNRVTRNRVQAVRALATWPVAHVSDEVRAELERLAWTEPLDRNRRSVRELLAAWSEQ